MNVARLFHFKLRGFRVVDLTAVAVLAALVLGVYGFKALAGRESAKIGDMDAQIAEEQHRVRLLKAELAHLEQPERIERLSTDYLGLAPLSAKREAPADALTEIARHPADPTPVLAAAPPAPAPAASPPASPPVVAEATVPKSAVKPVPAESAVTKSVVAKAESPKSPHPGVKPSPGQPAIGRKIAAASQVSAESVAR